tara:strand:+ start:464 stop:619 length:156 start_codon:yes stop_codon:yes gene_type:complete
MYKPHKNNVLVTSFFFNVIDGTLYVLAEECLTETILVDFFSILCSVTFIFI